MHASHLFGLQQWIDHNNGAMADPVDGMALEAFVLHSSFIANVEHQRCGEHRELT